MRRRAVVWGGLAAVAACARPIPLSELAPLSPELLAPLPVDPAVSRGRLDNGLTWYVERHAAAERGRPDRAALRLVLDVGSVLEEDDQRGAAHLVEHLAFADAGADALTTWLASLTPAPGPHVNAHTGFDETVYELSVPAGEPGALERGLGVLAGWATGRRIDDVDVERARAVVLEELSGGLGAPVRIQRATVPAMFFASPYADRLPMGSEEAVRAVTPEAVRRFRDAWYRPDRMAVIAVGDFDVDEVVAAIEARFGGLPGPGPGAPARPRYEVPGHADTKYVVVAAPDVTRAAVGVSQKHDRVEGRTVADYRMSLLENLAFAMINERLIEIARRSDAPFLAAGAGIQRLTPSEAAFALSAAAGGSAVAEAYRALSIEVRRVREHGFREPELARARSRVLEVYDDLERDQARGDSATEANELVRAFVTGEAVPGPGAEVALARRFVPTVGLAELDAWAHRWMRDASRVVTVMLPERDGVRVPSAAELAAIDAEVAAMAIAPPAEEAPIGALVPALPPPGAVVEVDERYVEALGFTGWVLSNGVRVWFRRMAGDVRLSAFSPGGASRVADEDAFDAALALEVAAQSGLGALDATELARWLAGRRVTLGRGLTERFETLSGSAAPDDFEALLVQVWASFASPRLDEAAFARAIERRRTAEARRQGDPLAAFHDAFRGGAPPEAWTARLRPDDARARSRILEDLAQADLERAAAAYADRFGDAGDFTFVLVGDLPDDLRDLVVRYLATLPATDRDDAPIERAVASAPSPRRGAPPPGRIDATVRAGSDLARVRLQWRGTLADDDWVARRRLYALGAVLQALLREGLGLPGIGVVASEDGAPESRYAVTVEFACEPERVDALVAAAEAVVDGLRAHGPSPEAVAEEQDRARRARRRSEQDSAFWANALAAALQRGADPTELLGWDARNDGLTAEALRDAARARLDEDQRVKLVLLPAEPDEAPQ
jgi:zinc protease